MPKPDSQWIELYNHSYGLLAADDKVLMISQVSLRTTLDEVDALHDIIITQILITTPGDENGDTIAY